MEVKDWTNKKCENIKWMKKIATIRNNENLKFLGRGGGLGGGQSQATAYSNSQAQTFGNGGSSASASASATAVAGYDKCSFFLFFSYV